MDPQTLKSTDPLPPTTFVIFGGTGDLTWRKLVPALFDLAEDHRLPEQFAIVVAGRSKLGDLALRNRLHEGVVKFSRAGKTKPSIWKQFAEHIHYQQVDPKKVSAYAALGAQCAKLEKGWGSQALRIFYLATPPSMFAEIPKYLGKAGLARDREFARLVIEKPIGYDLESARSLNAVLAANFDESQIFRIDHYLGKETVQNILAFRFANPLFEPIWNRHYIDSVTITVAETVGVEQRGDYYDQAGALRDMVQNHLLQLLCLVAMEPMVSFEADEIRNKKVDVLHAARSIARDLVSKYAVRGQYDAGTVDGKKKVGYRDEKDIAPDSQTETFVALKLFIDNWRWQDVPFYLRTGKHLPQQTSEICIQFRAVPHRSFPIEASLGWQPSRLILAIQPEEGIVLGFQAKHPGPKLELRPVDMRFSYRESFTAPSPDAYETLLWDVMKKDPTLFMRADQVEAAWQVVMPILEAWKATAPSDFPNYAAGTWGPETVQHLLEPGHNWPTPTGLKPSFGRTNIKN